MLPKWFVQYLECLTKDQADELWLLADGDRDFVERIIAIVAPIAEGERI